ncbi:Bax inhibitor-1 family protein [Clostridium sp.]|uniref:Bax inhibitor-1 family protein n=1 Tax=Clostridium sp. TaxID=1506 RepID=UPI002901F47C|nr:Bax inhibitor-1 family protein [Clostridium sp.]MDU2896097.1 Bax inhibitor-1 family protein [Clostridium sp.]
MNNIVKQNYLQILKTFFLGLIFLAIGSFAGVYLIPYSIKSILNIAFFIVVLFSMFSRKGGFIRSKSSMYIYALILGVLSGSSYVYYFYRLGSGLFISVVIGGVLIFGIAYIIALRSSDENIFRLAPFVWGGVFALFILEILNIFLFRFSTYTLVISAIGIIIYSVYAIIIMKSIQRNCQYGVLSEQEIAIFAYSIFISFLNLLLDLLRFVSIIQSDDR